MHWTADDDIIHNHDDTLRDEFLLPDCMVVSRLSAISFIFHTAALLQAFVMRNMRRQAGFKTGCCWKLDWIVGRPSVKQHFSSLKHMILWKHHPSKPILYPS